MQGKKSNNQKKLYFAAPLFSEAEFRYNKYVKELLVPFFEIYLPQEDGDYIPSLVEGGMELKEASKRVFDNDIESIKECDCLLIILDGRRVDEGAAFELGVAYILGKECFGLQTDSRRLLPSETNPMLYNSLSRIFYSVEELKNWAKIISLKK